LPKQLTEDKLTVSVQRKETVSVIDIEIIETKRYRLRDEGQNGKYDQRFYILLPGSSIVSPSGDIISCEDLPLGRKEIILEKYPKTKKLIIEDARNISLNGRSSGSAISLSGRVHVLATNSPQRIEGINDLIKK
jgi:hypothetical protein